ncbi:MAG: hypothetical protein AB7K09_15665 [Planctomycetota bacterium]
MNQRTAPAYPFELGRSDLPGSGVDPYLACAAPADAWPGDYPGNEPGTHPVVFMLPDGRVIGSDDPDSRRRDAERMPLDLMRLIRAWMQRGLQPWQQPAPGQKPGKGHGPAQILLPWVQQQFWPHLQPQLNIWIQLQQQQQQQQPGQQPQPQPRPQGNAANNAAGNVQFKFPPAQPGEGQPARPDTPPSVITPGQVAPVLRQLQATLPLLMEALQRRRVPCGGSKPYAWEYPTAPIDVDVVSSAAVVGNVSGKSWTTLATYTVPDAHRGLIEGFGVEDEDDDYTNMAFRVRVNGTPRSPWIDFAWPPGGMSTDTMRRAHIEVAPGDQITVEAYHQNVDTRTVHARLIGVVFPC